MPIRQWAKSMVATSGIDRYAVHFVQSGVGPGEDGWNLRLLRGKYRALLHLCHASIFMFMQRIFTFYFRLLLPQHKQLTLTCASLSGPGYVVCAYICFAVCYLKYH